MLRRLSLPNKKPLLTRAGEEKAKRWRIKGQSSEKSSSSEKARVAGITGKGRDA